MTSGGSSGDASLCEEPAHRRLEHLYEISQLFVAFDDIERSFDPVLGIAARTLPLRSAILLEKVDGHSRMIVWPSEGQDAHQLRLIKDHAEAAYGYLIGAPSEGTLELHEQPGQTVLPKSEGKENALGRRFIVIPLVVAHHQPFGALQLEGARPLNEADLRFVNALVNQLAIALDRHRRWRRDVTRRERAEVGESQAEGRRDLAERERSRSDAQREKSEALAEENARLYEEAQRAVGMREQILALVSHDLKNPLVTILLTANLIASKEALAESQPALLQNVDRIRRGAQRMQRLIDDLLDFASIEAGRLALVPRPEDPGSLVRETLTAFEGAAVAAGLHLRERIELPLPRISCDRDRILQVLSNLVGNAIKATAAGGSVVLRVAARAGEVLFSVSDTGPGISEEDLAHLFERYWRSNESQYKGTGLGLAIARGIVSAHGGRIWVESTLGRGAAFHFTVPTADSDESRPSP